MTSHRRHLHELDGQREPESGLQVRAYQQPINFEYQVEQHMRSYAAQLKDRPGRPRDRKAVERKIRHALAIGAAWLHAEPQLNLF